MHRILNYSFRLFATLLIVYGRLYRYFTRQRVAAAQAIAVLPYTPEGWPGGKDRMAAWKPFFEADAVKFHVLWAWSQEEMLAMRNMKKLKQARKLYALYYTILLRRFRVIISLSQYSAVWVQRAFIPDFPFNSARFERLAALFNPNICYDFYDADYVHNRKLVEETASAAACITVASMHLYHYFSSTNSKTYFLRYAIETENFVAQRKHNNTALQIGWMGSPDNALQLLDIALVLQQLESEFPQIVFSFACRAMPDLQLKNMKVQQWGDPGFVYEEWLAGIDIGMVPYLNPTETVKAKIAMKSLEFMANGIAMVVSPYMHSDKLEHNKSVMIATTTHEWYEMLKQLIVSEELRRTMGENARQVFANYHTYANTYAELRYILLP